MRWIVFIQNFVSTKDIIDVDSFEEAKKIADEYPRHHLYAVGIRKETAMKPTPEKRIEALRAPRLPIPPISKGPREDGLMFDDYDDTTE